MRLTQLVGAMCLLLAACGGPQHARGEGCQVDDDCADGLVCRPPTAREDPLAEPPYDDGCWSGVPPDVMPNGDREPTEGGIDADAEPEPEPEPEPVASDPRQHGCTGDADCDGSQQCCTNGIGVRHCMATQGTCPRLP